MHRISENQRVYFQASCFGIVGAIVNALLVTQGEAVLIGPGNLLIFFVAQSFGVYGALLSSLFCSAAVFVGGADPFLLRVIPLALTCGIVARRSKLFPPFLAVLLLWSVVLIPGAFFFTIDPIKLSIIACYAMIDVLMVLATGTLLLNQSVWALVTKKPRIPSLYLLLTHLFPLTCSSLVLACFGVLTLSSGSSTLIEIAQPDLSPLLPALLALGVSLPALLAFFVAKVATQYAQQFSNLSVMGKPDSFSGLNSNYWRRKASTDQAPVLITHSGLSTHDGARPTSSDNALAVATPVPLQTLGNVREKGICAVRKDGTILFVNRLFRSLAEIRSNEIIGRKFEMIDMNRDLRATLAQLADESFAHGPRVKEVKLNSLPAPLRYLELTTLSTEALEGSSLGGDASSIVITISDITNRRTVETHLVEAQQASLVKLLTYGLIHSLRNGLQRINIQAGVVQQLTPNFEAQRELTKLSEISNGLGEQLADFGELMEKKQHLLGRHNSIELLRGKEKLFRQATTGACELRINYPSQEIWIECAETLITQAITNLILNAQESYDQDGGVIDLSIDTETIHESVAMLHPGAKPGDYLRIKIKDYGVGMSTEVLAHAFDPLYTTKRRDGHTGLGLSVVYGVVRAHDGFLVAESSTGKGTAISLYIPIKEATTQAKEGAAVVTPHSTTLKRGAGQTVLVVEDDLYVRGALEKMLALLNYRVTSVADGEQALQSGGLTRYDAAIVDLVTPRIHGDELVTKFKAQSPSTKIILMSGDISACIQHEKDHGVLNKPFEITTLADTLHRSLTL